MINVAWGGAEEYCAYSEAEKELHAPQSCKHFLTAIGSQLIVFKIQRLALSPPENQA